MSKYQSNSTQDVLQDQSIQAKIMRFHPYYYLGRRGTYYTNRNERYQIKIMKFGKEADHLEIYCQERKKDGYKFTIFIPWEDLFFDYYTLESDSWRIKFSK